MYVGTVLSVARSRVLHQQRTESVKETETCNTVTVQLCSNSCGNVYEAKLYIG